jgi:hypothetical protein
MLMFGDRDANACGSASLPMRIREICRDTSTSHSNPHITDLALSQKVEGLR